VTLLDSAHLDDIVTGFSLFCTKILDFSSQF
jgi:hypothetical protein